MKTLILVLVAEKQVIASSNKRRVNESKKGGSDNDIELEENILISLSLTCSKYKTLEPSTISAAGHVINLQRERERERES